MTIEQEIIIKHLTLYEPGPPVQISACMTALRDARGATQRDPTTGLRNQGGQHGSWLGAMGYLTLLDQLGCFKPSNASAASPERNSILKALSYFTKLSKREAYAIYALRCSLMHDYGLYNIPNIHHKDKDILQHHFVVCGGDKPLVKLPDKPWDGRFNDPIDIEMETWVNLTKLGDLVEQIYNDLLELATEGKLVVDPDSRMTAAELPSRYWLTHF